MDAGDLGSCVHLQPPRPNNLGWQLPLEQTHLHIDHQQYNHNSLVIYPYFAIHQPEFHK